MTGEPIRLRARSEPKSARSALAEWPRSGALRWTAVAIVGLLILSAVAYVAICGYMALSLTRVERHPFTHFPEDYGLAYESVSFPSRVDHINLDGWLLPPTPGAPARRPVVVVHGKGSDREAEADGHTLDIAARLIADGHAVLLFDLRGSGHSGGERFTLGAQEVRDVGGAIDYLDSRGIAGDGVDLLGYSMGASTALLLAPDEPRIRAVAEDSGYADLGPILDDQAPKASGLPRFFTPGMVFLAQPLLGIDAYAIRPIERVPMLAARGVGLMVIHGLRDDTVPVSNGYALAAAYGAGAETYFVPGADHVGSYTADPATYLKRLVAFLDR